MAFFCKVTGRRIAAPGVSVAVDATNGQPECCEIDGKITNVAPEPLHQSEQTDAVAAVERAAAQETTNAAKSSAVTEPTPVDDGETSED